MWHVSQIDSSEVELDFQSSGQGKHVATALGAHGVQLFNAIDLVEYRVEATQVFICESCGYPNCESGGWVKFRRIGDSVIGLPAWSEMEMGEQKRLDFHPPSFLVERGPMVISGAAWEKIRWHKSAFPPLNGIPVLGSRDGVRALQWAAPGGILGKYPATPRLNREYLLAVTTGEVKTEARIVDNLLQDYFNNPSDLCMIEVQSELSPIEFFVDLPGCPGWSGVARDGENVILLVDQELPMIKVAS